MIRASLLVLAGGIAAQHSRVPLGSDLCKSLFVAVLVMFFMRRSRWLALLLLGFLLFTQAGAEIVAARLDSQFAGDSMLTRVRVVDFPRATGSSVTMLIEPLDDARLPPRSRVTWFEPPQMPVIGDIWEFEVRLRRPHGSINPGVFNLENWMFREKLHASGYIVAGKRNRLLESGRLSPVGIVRRDFVDLARTVGGESAAVLAAIGVGARHLISREQWERYAKTGTSHLMAISGLHIGLAAAGAFSIIALVSGGLRLRGNHLDRAIAGAAAIAAAYAIVSGFAVPSQRATIMLGLFAVAFRWRRRPDSARIVAQVALVVFVMDPVSSMTPGFSLSFGAVAVLLWFARSYRRPVSGAYYLAKTVAAVGQLIAMQCVLLLGLMPLTVAIFQRVALVAPAVNFVTVPIFSVFIVPLTLLGMVLHSVWESAGRVLLRLSAASITGIEHVIAAFARLPLADISIAGAGISWFVVLLPVLWVVLPRGWPGRWIAALGVFALLLHEPRTPPQSCFDMVVLDVGQGLAVVVQSKHRTLVFDTGASYRSGGSAVEHVVWPFLRHQGISVIDWLVVSHGDNDHAGGATALARRLEISQTYVGEPLPDFELSEVECAAGHSWHADGIDFRFLYPESGSRHSGNNASCVLSVSAGRYRVLLTGDIEVQAEQELLARLGLESASVVLIPHHGSLTSSSTRFVNRLRPDLAIASAGFGNQWGFPKERVTKRWEGIGATVLDTATSGAISLRVCARDGITQLREERGVQQRFWHDPA